MLISLFFLLLAISCFYGLTRDTGIYTFIVLIGFLQDPARKLIAGEPVLMTIMVGVVVVCVALRRLLTDKKAITEPFIQWTPGITTPLLIYICIILLQGIHSLLLYGSPILTGLGAIFYIAPLIAIIVGYSQFHKAEFVRHFFVVFCVLAIIAAVSVLLSFSGVDSELLGEVGSGLIIYDQGTILKAHSGLMRSSEIASWHMAASLCFLIILTSDRRSVTSIAIVSIIMVLLLSSIILTGRRKMILQIVIFSSLYFPILRFYQGRFTILASIIVGFAVVTILALGYWLTPQFSGTEYNLYFARGTSVFGDAGERFSSLGIGSIGWAYELFGFFGGGLGVATQGSQHFVEGNVGGAGEGGLGKIVSELGLVSLIFIAWLSYAFAKHIHRCLKLISRIAPSKLVVSVGVLTFLLSNVPTFIVASQVYGDVFVLLILGMLMGALFALPKLAIAELVTNNAPSKIEEVKI